MSDVLTALGGADRIRYISHHDDAGIWSARALSVTDESVLVHESGPVAADLAGGAVVLSVRADAYFGFNCTATEIWHMLAEPCRVGEVLALLAERHDVDAETVARDVIPFLQTLVEYRLVRAVDPASAS